MEWKPEWPGTRRDQQSRPDVTSRGELSFTTADYLKAKDELGFHRLSSAILKFCQSDTAPDEALPELLALSRRATLDSRDGMDHIILAFACTEVLRHIPSANTWSRFWSLVWYDALLALDLPRIAMTIAQEDTEFKEILLRIASEVIDRAIENPGWRAFTNDRDHFPELREYWKRNAKLINLWWGLREARATDFRADEGMLGIVATLDTKIFMDFLQRFDNPYPILYALRAARAEWSFAAWKDLLSVAPVSFDNDRTWNGSAVVPLLLCVALQKISEAQAHLRPDASDSVVKEVATEIENLAGEVAKVVAGRPDAGSCAERWSVWLMRQCLAGLSNEPLPFPANAKSHGYVSTTLLTALGRELSGHSWSLSAAPDAEPWEEWSYRCVLVALAAEGRAVMPQSESFLKQWQLSPEEWSADRGRLLRESAALFETFGKRADAFGTRLLAISLAVGDRPHETWTLLWDATQTIRDIVEFGDPEDRLDSGIGTETDACQLMRLAFGLGLMMLDCIVDPGIKIVGDRRVALESQFSLLASAVGEMSSIDRFDRNYWGDALRHVAVRRAIWSEGADKVAATFRREAKPFFTDFIVDLSADTERLFALIEVALRNKVKLETLRRALDEANVNLPEQIALAERLVTLSEKRAGVGALQIDAARSLLSAANGVI